MTVPRRRKIQAILAMTLAASTLAAMWLPLREAQRFHVPSQRETRAAQDLFAQALADHDAAAIGPGAQRLGLAAASLEGAAGLVLAEPSGDCAGRGAYALRSEGGLPLALVTPHRGSDRHTGTIADLLFREQSPAAVAWNTAPRTTDATCPAAGDVTRVPTHYLTAFSLAFARRYPAGRIVQIHGFARSKRETAGAADADAVISDGTEAPGARLLDVADCLSRLFPERRVAVYPLDTRELGGTTNAQGRALRAMGFHGFVHLELATAWRTALAGDPAERARLFACLGAGL